MQFKFVAPHTARAAHGTIVDQICAITKGYVIFHGKIVDVQRRIVAGFARGEAILDGIDADVGRRLSIEFQNENLVATCNNEVIVSLPDLITIVEEETGEPITTESLRYGFRVKVLGIPSDLQWRTPTALRVVGPRYFGYEIDFTPVEERMRQ